MDSNDLNPCEVLEWDSAFFGFRIARLREAYLTAEMIGDALEWCDREKIRCLYLLAPGDCLGKANLAGANGFTMVDLRFTLDRDPGVSVDAVEPVRAFHESDLPKLRSIARVSHRDSRFYSDPAFPDQRCDELYETWIDRSCHGYADQVFVAEHLNQTAGYISCHIQPQGIGAIGLLAVADGCRGVGLGGRLVAGALHFFAEAGCKNVRVITQGRNIAAQRLYQKCGFRSASMELWFHRWFEQAGL